MSEILAMDIIWAQAVIERLPTLDDGMAGKILEAVFTKKR